MSPSNARGRVMSYYCTESLTCLKIALDQRVEFSDRMKLCVSWRSPVSQDYRISAGSGNSRFAKHSLTLMSS